jgi:O-antigen/teichoic acid export membrane protein
MLIVITPLLSLQNTLAHFSARFKVRGHAASTRKLVVLWYRRLALPGLLIMVLGILFRHALSAFFHLDTPVPIVLVSVTLFAGLLLPVIPGALQGLQAFIWMCLALHMWGVLRLIIGALLVWMVSPLAIWGIVAQLAGICLALVLGWAGLTLVLRGENDEVETMPATVRYFAQSFFSLLFFAFLMNADVVMVKHFFPPEEAGMFAQAATIGRMTIFLCQPVAMALFPKVVSSGEFSRAQRLTLIRGLVLSVLLVGGMALVLSLVPAVPLRLLYGISEPSTYQLRLVRTILWAMAPLGITFLLVNFEMAQHRFKMNIPLALCAAGYLTAVTVWHTALGQVVLVLGAVSLASSLSLMLFLPWRTGMAPRPTDVTI